MKNKATLIKGIIGLCTVSLLILSCNQIPSDVKQQIKESNQALMNAVSEADTVLLTGMYTKDAKLFPANGLLVDGQQAISKFWVATFGMGIKKVEFETVSALKYGNIAIEEGNYKLYVDGDFMVDQGKYLVNWKMENGKWKVYRDIWNANEHPPKEKASTNDTVLIVHNFVKPDKTTQFEDFYINRLAVAGAEFSPKVKQTVRVQKPLRPNKDGTFTYTFIMDPYHESFNYDILYTLKAKYPEEEANRIMQTYIDCLKDGKSIAYLSIETGW